MVLFGAVVAVVCILWLGLCVLFIIGLRRGYPSNSDERLWFKLKIAELCLLAIFLIAAVAGVGMWVLGGLLLGWLALKLIMRRLRRRIAIGRSGDSSANGASR